MLTLSTNDLLHLTKLSVKDVNRLQYCAADALHVFNPVTGTIGLDLVLFNYRFA